MAQEDVEKQDLTRSKNEIFNTNRKRLEDIIFNLADDIKDYQRKLKLLGQQNKKVEDLSKKIISKLTENNYEIIQVILTKKKRTSDELMIIKTFLSTLKYLSSMIKILDVDRILLSLSIYLKMQKKSKDSILFRFGNKGTKFYILLSGQVTILILKETVASMNFFKYIMHLIMLKVLGEGEMVKKIIMANYQNKIRLDEKTFDKLYEKIESMGNKILGKKKKNKKEKDEEESEENEESESESEEKKKKIKKNKENDEIKKNDEIKEPNDIPVKRHQTLSLNYLVSNFNGLLNAKNYKYVKTTFKNENMDSDNLPKIKTASSTSKIKSFRKSVIPSSHLHSQFSLFLKEAEIQGLVSYYLYLKESIGNFKKKKFSVSDYIEETYINSSYSKPINETIYKDKEKFILYKYHDIVQKSKGDTFGELALQHEDSKRTATIITNTECILGYLSKSAYEACLSEIELKRRKHEVNFIMSFAIFDQMNWISFENKYFNYFKREFCSQSEIIIKQGEISNKIFFIMDGQFEISSSLSIGGIFRIIRQKRRAAVDKYELKLNKQKHKLRLSICNNKDIIGLSDCCFFNQNGEEISFVNVTCISNKSIVFTLEKSILNSLKKKIPEISDNLKEIIDKREKIMVDRLISIFNIFLKKRQIKINKNLMKNKTRNNSSKNPKKFDFNKEKAKNDTLKEKEYSIENKRLYSANYKEARPLSTISYTQKQSIDETISNQSPKIKSYFSTKGISNTDKENLYKSKISSEKLTLRQNFYTILTEKSNKNTFNRKNDLKSAKKFKGMMDENNIKRLYQPLTNTIQKEYNNLFNWIDNINNNNHVTINSNIIKKVSEGKEENKNYKNTIPLDNSKKFFENDSFTLLNKKFVNNEKSDKIIGLKELNPSFKNNINKKDSGYINKSSFHSKKEEDKINSNKNDLIIPKTNFRIKTISNEAYLKQILGNKYRDQDDEFISYAEKKLMKTINDYNSNLAKITKMKLRFKKKMKKNK